MPFLRLGPLELIIILGVIVIAVFGAGKLAGLGGAVGKAVKDFRSATEKNEEEAKADAEKKDEKSG